MRASFKRCEARSPVRCPSPRDAQHAQLCPEPPSRPLPTALHQSGFVLVGSTERSPPATRHSAAVVVFVINSTLGKCFLCFHSKSLLVLVPQCPEPRDTAKCVSMIHCTTLSGVFCVQCRVLTVPEKYGTILYSCVTHIYRSRGIHRHSAALQNCIGPMLASQGNVTSGRRMMMSQDADLPPAMTRQTGRRAAACRHRWCVLRGRRLAN